MRGATAGIRRGVATLSSLLWALALCSPAGAGSPVAPPPGRAPAPASAKDADSLLTAAGVSRAAGAALRAWAARATLHELVYLLRRDRAELGAVGPELARRALERAPEGRSELRLRLALRLAALKPGDRAARRALAARGVDAARLPARPGASAYRVGAALPLSGDYEIYGRSVVDGAAVALAEFNRRYGVGLELVAKDSPGDGPWAAAAVADTLAQRCGVLVGELLSPATYAMASLARGLGLPLVSPTAPDESVGRVGSGVFQVGPSGVERGRALARTVLAGRAGSPFAMLWSSAEAADPLARGFRAQAESLGARLVWEGRYAPGNEDFRASIRALKRREPAVLFWEGDAREAERLVRQLVQEKVKVGLCGGAGFEPQHVHSEVRALLNGAFYVGEDWKLSDALEAALAAGLPAGQGPPNRLHVRGYLAGRAIAAVLGEGALCPEELAAGLRRRLAGEPYLAERGFLRWSPEEARLSVFRVELGRPVPAQ